MTSDRNSIRSPAGPLRFAGTAGGRVVLAGHRCRAYGAELAGLEVVMADGERLLERLDPGLGPCDTCARSLCALERGWSAHPGLQERSFVLPAQPGVAVEWASSTDLRLSWRVPDAVRWRIVEGRLTTLDRGGRRRLFCVDPPPRWTATQKNGALDVRAVIGPEHLGTVTLTAILRQPNRGRRRDTKVLGRLGTEQTRAATDLVRAREDSLVMECTNRAVQTAFAWAIARLQTMLPEEGLDGRPFLQAPQGQLALIAGLGALAVGRFDAADGVASRGPGVLRDLVRRWNPPDAIEQAADPPVSLRAMLDRLVEPSAGLIPLGRARPPAQPAEDPTAAWLAAWHHFDMGESRMAARVFDRLFEVGRRGGLAWAASDGLEEELGLTALVPATLVFGALGARADASVGRLRLAPRLPEAWGAVTVRNLRMGDARLTLEVRKRGEAYVFTVWQTRGAVPINLVFEPTVPANEIVLTRVDGSTAELDPVPLARRVGIKLQLPVDRRREVTIIARN